MNENNFTKNKKIANIILFMAGIFCQISPLISRYGMLIYLILLLGILLFYQHTLTFKITKGFKWYFIFCLIVYLSLIYTINYLNADYVLLRVTSYLILVFLISNTIDFSKNNYSNLENGIIIGGILGIIIVLSQQWNLIGIARLGEGPNLYGSYAEFGAVCQFTMIAIIWKLYNKKHIKFNFLFFLISFVGIILSGARKAILMPIIFSLCLFVFNPNKKISKKIFYLTIISLFFSIFIYLSLKNELLYNAIGKRIETGINEVLGYKSSDESLEQRSLFKDIGIEMIKQKPIFGWGVHSYAIKNYNITGRLVYSHDTFIEVLACYGLVGFIAYFSVYFIIFINIKKILNQKNVYGLFFISITITVLLMEPFSVSFLSSYSIIFLSSELDFLDYIKLSKKILTSNIKEDKTYE